jgi:hypothetical protein
MATKAGASLPPALSLCAQTISELKAVSIEAPPNIVAIRII